MEDTLLVIHRVSHVRKIFRRHLETLGERVLALETLGSAIPRLRARRYELLICADPPSSSRWAWVEDYRHIVKKAGVLARTAKHEIWCPAEGIQCDAIVIVPGADAAALHAAVLDARARRGVSA